MKAGSLATFTTIDVLLVLTPGPDWAYVVAVGLRDRMVLPAVGGLVAGYAALTGMTSAGLAALITTRPGFLTAVTLAGGAYLIWLGASVLSHPSDSDAPRLTPRMPSAAGVAARGAATSGLNPKGVLLFVAVLPQFVDRRGGLPVAIQLGLLGAVHMANCAIFYTSLSTLARSALAARPTAARALTRAAGAAMIVLGVLLLLERVLSSA